jgi:hypothetical protein
MLYDTGMALAKFIPFVVLFAIFAVFLEQDAKEIGNIHIYSLLEALVLLLNRMLQRKFRPRACQKVNSVTAFLVMSGTIAFHSHMVGSAMRTARIATIVNIPKITVRQPAMFFI